MTTPFSGGCACGSIRYVCSRAPIAMLNCHCRDCQRSSGAPFASGFIIQVSDTAITGTPKTYSVRAGSGSLATRSFCSECGSPLFTRGEAAPGVMSIRFTTLDNPSKFQPMLDIWDYLFSVPDSGRSPPAGLDPLHLSVQSEGGLGFNLALEISAKVTSCSVLFSIINCRCFAAYSE
jgi:hypothetical protein